MKAMRARLLLGPVMIALLVAGVLLDEWVDGRVMPAGFASWTHGLGIEGDTFPPGTVLLPIVLLLCAGAARELSGLLESEGIEGSKRATTVAAVAGVLVSCLVPSTLHVVDAVASVATTSVLVLVMAMVFYSRHKTVEGVIAATGGVLLSYVYLGLMAGFVLAIRRENPAWTLLWLLLTVKACDIGAYFVGHAIGRRKLIPWLSPGKTWEGLLGGVALSGAVGGVGLLIADRRSGLAMPSWEHGVVLGVLLGVTGQVGDLLESVLKRDAGKKDSGRVIPGFGGLLDVVDSPLLAAPVAFWWLRLMEEQGYFVPRA
jgi:phosphatidate cytidylyltransferase